MRHFSRMCRASSSFSSVTSRSPIWRAPAGSSSADSHEEAVGVAVEDAIPAPRHLFFRPEKDLAAEARDRVRQCGVGEAARRRAEHAVERVHQDLDRLAGDGIAGAPGRLAPREEIVEKPRKDPGLATEARSVGGDDGIEDGPARARVVIPDQTQRIDLERADDARVQTPEIEHEHVAVETGHRLEHVSARAGLHLHPCCARDARRHDAPARQLGEIEEVERRDARRDPVGRHPGETAASHREVDEMQPLQDPEREHRIVAVVLHEAGEIVAPGLAGSPRRDPSLRLSCRRPGPPLRPRSGCSSPSGRRPR